MRKGRRRAAYWSRARVVSALQQYAARFGHTPTSSEAWGKATAGLAVKGNAAGNPYPSFATVLRHFTSFRAAWTACGIEVGRGDEPWTPDEEWFITEACGLLSRNEIAEYLGRTPDAVHRRLYDLGVDSRKQRGWTAHRAMMATGVGDHVIREYADRGELPILRGTKCVYFDPADLLVVQEIDWRRISDELAAAIRRSLMARMVAVLSGRNWRATSPYKVEVTRKSKKRWREANRQQTFEPPPFELVPGDVVQMNKPHPEIESLQHRHARVFGVFFSRTTQRKNKLREGLSACWVARVEYANDGLPRVNATIPFVYLRKVRAEV